MRPSHPPASASKKDALGSPDSDAERLKFVLASARLGDWSWDARTDVVTFSARAAEICGIPAEMPMTASVVRELVHPDDREAVRAALDQAIREHEDYSSEHRLLWGGGRERWVTGNGRGRYDEHGACLGMFGVLQEITNDRFLVRVDDAVRALVEPENITYTAARVLGQFMGANRCAYAFVEADQDTFILTGNYANGVESIVGRYRFRQFGAECLRLMRAGEPYVVDDSAIDARVDDDDRKAYQLTAIRGVICVPILKSGRFVAAMAVHTAMPRNWHADEVELVQQVASRCWESIERARVERERQALLEAAEAANRAKDEFLAMLGHELRNPLSPILTALQIMKLRDERSSEHERTVIERQVKHLTRLVDDLLDVARIARGKVVLKRELVELAAIIARAIEVASPLLEQRAHAIEVDAAATGLLVEGDVERLTQVVSNLLTNSGKYTPSGGRITVSAWAEDDEVVLRVRDTGIGMTPTVLEHAFELFAQGGQASDRAHGGLGLGLTIVRSLVEGHGGSVSASSAGPDQGSELVVRLPRAQGDAAGIEKSVPPPSVADASSVEGGRVLVVDDNRDAAEMLAEALGLLGCQVRVAHDGPQALRLAAAHPFDIGLLDIGLPVMDGYQLVARLRELQNLRGACFVAVTGYGQESDRRRALAAGFQEHLVKPVDLGVVEVIVKDALTRQRAAKLSH